jgi:hypothetical protein
VIEPFDPRHHNIEEWLDAVDEFKAIYDWDDRTTSHLALNKLSGPAEVWYRGLPSRVFSWDQWRGKLLATFKIKRNLFDAMRAVGQGISAKTARKREVRRPHEINDNALLNIMLITTEVLPNERYRVEDIPGARRTKFRYRGVAAVDNLRPWVVFA